jgi:predicted transcriptional regulator
MEKSKHLDLLLLIAIRNNDKIPTDEFYTLFDHNWHVYSARFSDLKSEGLFIHSSLEHIQGSNRYELTRKGKLRISELLNERSIEIDVKLAQLKHRKYSSPVPARNVFSGIKGLIHLISTRFTSKPPSNRGLTVTDKGNGLRTY